MNLKKIIMAFLVGWILIVIFTGPAMPKTPATTTTALSKLFDTGPSNIQTAVTQFATVTHGLVTDKVQSFSTSLSTTVHSLSDAIHLDQAKFYVAQMGAKAQKWVAEVWAHISIWLFQSTAPNSTEDSHRFTIDAAPEPNSDTLPHHPSVSELRASFEFTRTFVHAAKILLLSDNTDSDALINYINGCNFELCLLEKYPIEVSRFIVEYLVLFGDGGDCARFQNQFIDALSSNMMLQTSTMHQSAPQSAK